MIITSDTQLEVLIRKAVLEAIEKVLDRAFELLQDEIVGAGIPANAGGLYMAWNDVVKGGIVSAINAELSFDPKKLTLAQLPFPDGRHGSTLNSRMGAGDAPSDVRNGFAEIIFEGLAPINPMVGQAGGTQPARDAWTPFIAELSAQLGNWIAEELRSAGLAVI